MDGIMKNKNLPLTSLFLLNKFQRVNNQKIVTQNKKA